MKYHPLAPTSPNPGLELRALLRSPLGLEVFWRQTFGSRNNPLNRAWNLARMAAHQERLGEGIIRESFLRAYMAYRASDTPWLDVEMLALQGWTAEKDSAIELIQMAAEVFAAYGIEVS